MAYPGLVESADARGNLLGAAERGIALGGAAEIHRVAVAQCPGGRVERLVVGLVEAREQQMTGAEMLDLAAGGLGGGGDLFQPGAIGLRCHDIRDPAIGETSGAGEGRVGAATDPNRRYRADATAAASIPR